MGGSWRTAARGGGNAGWGRGSPTGRLRPSPSPPSIELAIAPGSAFWVLGFGFCALCFYVLCFEFCVLCFVFYILGFGFWGFVQYEFDGDIEGIWVWVGEGMAEATEG